MKLANMGTWRLQAISAKLFPPSKSGVGFYLENTRQGSSVEPRLLSSTVRFSSSVSALLSSVNAVQETGGDALFAIYAFTGEKRKL